MSGRRDWKLLFLAISLIGFGVSIYSFNNAYKIKASQEHRDKAWQFRSNKQYDQAILEFQEALRLRPSSNRTKFNLATTLVKAGRYQEAVEAFEGGGMSRANLPCSEEEFLNRDISIGTPSEYVSYGRALSKIGRQEQAREIWQKVASMEWSGSEGSSEAKKMLQAP